MSMDVVVGLAAVAALAALAIGVIAYRRFVGLARRYHFAWQQAGFWTGAWVRDTRCLLRVCDEQDRQLATLKERIDALQQSLERARRQARASKHKEPINGVAPKPRRGGRNGDKPSS